MTYWAHETAIVDAPATIGAGTKIWHFCHVMAGARLGVGVVLGQNVFVGAAAVVGDHCRVQNNVSLYDGVELEAEVFVGPSAVFTNVRTPRATVSRRHALATTRVGRGATIGANETVFAGFVIGAHAFVAAGALVSRDVAPHVLVAGVPARATGWACVCGEILPKPRAGRLACGACATKYRLVGVGARARLSVTGQPK
ncbi:MAG: 2,3,4,5-tetrahydropyridine-2,6-dicarboxylate N-acetyltransferase [Myxococcales bacterium]|nr:2,3,4,5-tetrahydropyridine-2,6-dicarboxylate N-acetyltransferase [Myxococcales bacterium]